MEHAEFPQKKFPDEQSVDSNLDHIDDDHDDSDDDLDDDGTTKNSEDTPNSNCISCVMGSGLSLDQS